MYEKNIMKFIPVFHQIGEVKFIPVFHQTGEVQSGPPASFIISKKSGPSTGFIHKPLRINGGEGPHWYKLIKGGVSNLLQCLGTTKLS